VLFLPRPSPARQLKVVCRGRAGSALHGSGVAVVDAGANKVVATVDPIKDPNGIAYDASRLYVVGRRI
jgi:hypothetical protein